MRPRIGVTGPDRGGAAAWIFTAWSILRAGGWPVRITPTRPRDPSSLDALVIGGGADVSPHLYGAQALPPATEDARRLLETRGPGGLVGGFVAGFLRRIFSIRTARIDHARDRLETTLLAGAIRRRRPVLGICRGMQLLNVVCGGTLVRDIRPLYVEEAYVRSVWPRKDVRIEPASRLNGMLGRSQCRVNSLHRQAIRDLGADLRAVAWETSGIVQAIEGTHPTLVLGLQWHPEFLPQLESQRRLFDAFVTAAAS